MSASIKDPAKDVSNDAPAPSICAACGEEFSCGANSSCEVTPSSCWCFEVKLSETTRTELQSRYQGCLCNKCLGALAGDEHDVAAVTE